MTVVRSEQFQPRAVPSGHLGESIEVALHAVSPDLTIDQLSIAARFEYEGQPPQKITDLYTVCILNTDGLLVAGEVRRQPGLRFELRGHQHAISVSAQGEQGEMVDQFFSTLVSMLQLAPADAAQVGH